MKIIRWIFGALVLGAIIAFVILRPPPILFATGLPHIAFYQRAVYIIILACFLCLYRICRGPTGADRIVSVDILGIMIVGLCALLSVTTHRDWYIDIGIAWALQSFISTLALSKFLEGRDFDE